MCIICASGGRNTDHDGSYNPLVAATFTESSDAADGRFTTYEMAPGDLFYGTLSYGGDEDWVAVDLVAGETYTIAMTSTPVGVFGGVSDAYMTIYDSAGGYITYDDDGGVGRNSMLSFTADYTGTHFIEAGEWNFGTGGYEILVSNGSGGGGGGGGGGGTGDGGDPLEAIDWGGATLNTNDPIRVYFAPSGVTLQDRYDGFVDSYTSEGFSSSEQNMVMEILDGVSEFANIEFVQTSSSANADFRLVSDQLNGLYGFMNPQGSTDGSDGLMVLDSDFSWWNSTEQQQGGFAYNVVIHELGHGLGLAHPHDTGGGSSVMSGVTPNNDADTGDFDLNQGVFTVMSYNDGWDDSPGGIPSDDSAGYSGGYSALDIAQLQEQYGANMNHATGNNDYYLNSLDYYYSIWDAGGTDTIRYTGNQDAYIDMRAATLESEEGGGGFMSYLENGQGGFTIAHGVVIERTITRNGDDTVQGNDADNRIQTKMGDDTVYGGDGSDSIATDEGADYLEGQAGDDFMYGGQGQDELYGGSGGDLMRGNRNEDVIYGNTGEDDLFGGGDNDELYGGANDDFLNGENGNDLLEGGGGNDVMRGGDGRDTFVFNTGDGTDIIRDFKDNRDYIDVSSMGLDFQDIMNMASNTSNGVKLEFSSDQILYIDGMTVAQLDADEFIF